MTKVELICHDGYASAPRARESVIRAALQAAPT